MSIEQPLTTFRTGDQHQRLNQSKDMWCNFTEKEGLRCFLNRDRILVLSQGLGHQERQETTKSRQGLSYWQGKKIPKYLSIVKITKFPHVFTDNLGISHKISRYFLVSHIGSVNSIMLPTKHQRQSYENMYVSTHMHQSKVEFLFT